MKIPKGKTEEETLKKINKLKFKYGMLMVAGGILTVIFGIWICVSFVVYLVKDIPFHWFSLPIFIISIIASFWGYVIVDAIDDVKEEIEREPKLSFKEKLDRAMINNN